MHEMIANYMTITYKHIKIKTKLVDSHFMCIEMPTLQQNVLLKTTK